MGNEKYLLKSKKDWAKLKRCYGRTDFNDCDFREQPENYPCICVMSRLDVCNGLLDLKTYYQVDTFVYLTDFNQ